jgi:ribonuclease HI
MKPDNTYLIEIFTDGSCLGNPGPGGYAALIKSGTRKRLIKGGHRGSTTTNNRMELKAVIEGLKALKRPLRVTVIADSEYVTDGATKWLLGWKASGWRKSDGKPVLNDDLWRQIEALSSVHEVTWVWVKGHSGHPENTRVDLAAREAAQRVA